MDTATTSEAIDALIERRSEGRNAANEREAIWRASVEFHHAERREANRFLWIHYYRTLARNHAGLSRQYEEKANAL